MQTEVHEIADRIFRLATLIPGVGGPEGMTFNQFLIDAEEPLLFHTGHRGLFPLVSEAAKRVVPLDRLRWITYSHTEADEAGALNQWLEAAPAATAAQGQVGCKIWLNDAAARPPRALSADQVLDLGGKRVRYLATPHVPHGWDASMLFEETTGTLFCSDLFTHLGKGPAVTDRDILAPALAAEKAFGFTSLTPATAPTMRKLAALEPRTIAVMHGSSYNGDGRALLEGLADFQAGRLREAMAAA